MSERPWWHDQVPPGGEDALGSAAQEAARLFTALRDRIVTDPAAMRAGLRMLDTLTSLRAAPPHGTALPGDAPECAYCPVCQAMVRARRLNPDGVERLAGAAVEFADTVRQVVLDMPAPPPADVVRHVRLDEDFGDWPEPVDVEREDAAPQHREETPDDGQ